MRMMPNFLNPPQSPSPSIPPNNPNPSLIHQTQQIVRRMQEEMIKTIDSKDSEILLLRQQLQNSRALAVKAEIAYLSKRKDDLEEELRLTSNDLRAKKAQFREIRAQGVGVIGKNSKSNEENEIASEGSNKGQR